MTEEKKKKKEEAKPERKSQEKAECRDIKCPFHGTLSLRGRVFRGTVVKRFPKRAVIEFERTIYFRKFERFAKSKTKLHAHVPECMEASINLGDYVKIRECRKLSKIISFVVTEKIRGKEEKEITGAKE